MTAIRAEMFNGVLPLRWAGEKLIECLEAFVERLTARFLYRDVPDLPVWPWWLPVMMYMTTPLAEQVPDWWHVTNEVIHCGDAMYGSTAERQMENCP
jgi:hypothetical protein